MATEAEIEQAAERLWQAFRQQHACEPVRNLIGLDDIAAAYAVQERNTARRQQEGGRIVGRKIGLTAAAVQRQFGIAQPDYGMLFDDMDIAHGSKLAYNDGLHVHQPRLETEIAFVLERDLRSERPTTAEAMSAVAYAVVALELVASRIRDWDIRIADTIADNGSAAGFVLGHRPRLLRQLDLLDCRMKMTCNGEEVSEGLGSDCLGSPVNALRWLAREMVQVGRPLLAGDVILSGALGPMVAAKPGQCFTGEVEGLGRVSLYFEDVL